MSLVSLLPTACPRCILRLQNIRTPPSYTRPIRPTPPCSLCLGILQDPALTALITALRPHLSALRHDRRFKINASLPISASLLRDRAARHVLHHANLHPASPTDPHNVSLREAVKWAVCARVHDAFGMRYHPDAQLFVDLSFSHTPSNSDAAFVHTDPANPHKRRRLQNDVSATAVVRAAAAMTDQQFVETMGPRFFPPPPIEQPAEVAVSVYVAPVLFAGRYNKLSRVVSQTPWFVDAPPAASGLAAIARANEGKVTDQYGRRKRTELSVEDAATAGIREVLNPDKATFTAGGREDVDVRMLGKGRPFVVEVINPKIVPALIEEEMVERMRALAASVSSSVVIRDFRMVSKEYFAQMRSFEMEKKKCYRCVVWTRREVGSEELKDKLEVQGGFMLRQKTPLRVLHRRTQAVRERCIFEARLTRVVSPNFFVMDVVAAAGTYIKEFVHGDHGRTLPNVAQLLDCDADIVQLDVTDIYTDSEKR
ncbi:unnamed protein product [Chondrus crispus]|uniref:tRNA pseudouridine(55) synthase n=1 Tax=Chondrus crispus TaxID=2769 RepID=R7QGX4_CHOCR|nr:unnamed protein product [Chondrus crispus]CDF37777.1 unnamed protein product [Chondrus crispus]|eukprot:XP_005717648.1 unnamed protein product [Chondrus crispus]